MPSASAVSEGPDVSADRVRLHIPSHVAELDGVRIELDWPLGVAPEFSPDGDGGWELIIPRPPVQRFEYKLKLRSGGQETTEVDPTNPLQVPGPFGAKSVIRFPDYREPVWLGTPVRGTTIEVADQVDRLAVPVPIRLFTPAALDPDTSAPLLIVHDGSDFADRGGLLAWACATERPVRVALLDPPIGYRNPWYSANPDYADHVALSILPALRTLVPVSSVAGLGASLGGLITRVLNRRHPESLDAMALQSGSFFCHKLDGQESSWKEFAQVCAAVEVMSTAAADEVRAVPTLFTVGTVEENRSNNEKMAGVLAFQGYPLDARMVPDAHNLIGWRDAWYPGLDRLMESLP